ncbi:hypothetical protein [Paenibacillus tianmuensis]|uniref:hypothetical protein n=1 Tax=Paenibacillus tianmuensis TaxID=624147 RepID=UPI001C27B75E|nr:hypothetical protein [Paenibacillus tianmuensis]
MLLTVAASCLIAVPSAFPDSTYAAAEQTTAVLSQGVEPGVVTHVGIYMGNGVRYPLCRNRRTKAGQQLLGAQIPRRPPLLLIAGGPPFLHDKKTVRSLIKWP